MAPTSHVGFAPIQVLAPATLFKVESVLPEQAVTIGGTMGLSTHALCAHKRPFISGVRASVPELHPSMSTTLEHFKLHKMPSTAKTPVSLTITPTMQAIVVDSVAIINPQLAAIVGLDAETIVACLEDSHAAGPASSKVITATESGPPASCVAIVDGLAPAGQLGPAVMQVLAAGTLPEVECIFYKTPWR
jgi:hypothetical protein